MLREIVCHVPHLLVLYYGKLLLRRSIPKPTILHIPAVGLLQLYYLQVNEAVDYRLICKSEITSSKNDDEEQVIERDKLQRTADHFQNEKKIKFCYNYK